VTVPRAFKGTFDARKILTAYRIRTVVVSGIGCAVLVAGIPPGHWPLLVFGELWLVFAPLVVFWSARERVLPHAVAPATVREASLKPRRTGLPGGWPTQLVPFAILGGTAIFLHLRWNQIPARFPVHWGIDGEPNGWSSRTPMGVFMPLIFGATLVAGISLLAHAIAHHARAVEPGGHDPTKPEFAHRVGVFLVAVEFLLAGLFSCTALLPLTGNPGIAPVLVLTIGIFASVFLVGRWMNRPRMKDENSLPSPPVSRAPLGDGTLDRYWNMGVFYNNPEDSALFVEKRFGIGYTLNFGHASAWVILALSLLLPLGLVLTAISVVSR
jgi:uncharacterized membrane protein